MQTQFVVFAALVCIVTGGPALRAKSQLIPSTIAEEDVSVTTQIEEDDTLTEVECAFIEVFCELCNASCSTTVQAGLKHGPNPITKRLRKDSVNKFANAWRMPELCDACDVPWCSLRCDS